MFDMSYGSTTAAETPSASAAHVRSGPGDASMGRMPTTCHTVDDVRPLGGSECLPGRYALTVLAPCGPFCHRRT